MPITGHIPVFFHTNEIAIVSQCHGQSFYGYVKFIRIFARDQPREGVKVNCEFVTTCR